MALGRGRGKHPDQAGGKGPGKEGGKKGKKGKEAAKEDRPLTAKQQERLERKQQKAAERGRKHSERIAARRAEEERKAALQRIRGPAATRETLLHSSQLDERMRQGDAEVRKQDTDRKRYLDILVSVALLFLVVVVVGKIGIGLRLGVAPQTYLLAAVTGILAGCSYLFNTIRWRALRGAQGQKVLHKAKSEVLLTAVSVLALFTVIVMAVVEILALLVFIGVIEQVGAAGVRFADNFVLFQTIMLLVYLLAIIAREAHVTSYQPNPKAVMTAKVLTPVALTVVFIGAVLASGIVRVRGVEIHQAVYVVTFGVLLEFLAMRIRLRLPSLVSLFRNAVEVAKRANPEVKDELRKRAVRTYVIGAAFVALSMAFAGAIATGAVGFGDKGTAVSLVVFYVGGSLILLGILAVRVFQALNLGQPRGDGDDELERLVSQKRKSPEEILRIAVYSITGLVAALALVMMILTGTGRMPWHTKYATDIFIVAVLFGAGPFGIFYNRELRRVTAMDDKFPDFLRDLAESARAGMTLPRALVSASQGTYGALTEEVQKMAAQVEWGVEFSEALERFAERARSPLIDRTVSLVVEAQRAGGNVVDILTAASEDAREIKQIVAERNSQMSMYSVVIYISFFVFIAVVLVLASQFIPAFKEAVGAASGQQVGGLRFKEFDPEDFNTIFFHAALAQAIGGGLVGGVLTKGKPVAGFLHIGIMMAMAWFSFRVVTLAL